MHGQQNVKLSSPVTFPCSYHHNSDSLWAGRSRERIPVGARVSVPFRTDSEAQSASCTMGTRSLPGYKMPGRGAYHPPTSNTEVANVS